jgi:RNA polymerase sigma-70 factor (ECF subfamily)
VAELGRASDGTVSMGEPTAWTRERLVAVLSKITPAQREVVLLHDLQGWTHPEIAESLGISEVMSRQHLFVARKALRALLGEGKQEEVGE